MRKNPRRYRRPKTQGDKTNSYNRGEGRKPAKETLHKTRIPEKANTLQTGKAKTRKERTIQTSKKSTVPREQDERQGGK